MKTLDGAEQLCEPTRLEPPPWRNIYAQITGSFMTVFLTVFSSREGWGTAAEDGSRSGALERGRCH